MNLLQTDIIETVLLKFHRFNYLCNISKTNKELNTITNRIKNFHYNKLNKLLETQNLNKLCNEIEINFEDKTEYIKNNINLYNNISKYIFNYKILNLKYYNFIKDIDTHNFIKIIILYNINCSTIKTNIHIISYDTYKNYLSLSKNKYYPFMIIYIKTGYSLHLEYNINVNLFRISLNNPMNKISLTKVINLEEIMKILGYSENGLFTFIYKNYLLRFFN